MKAIDKVEWTMMPRAFGVSWSVPNFDVYEIETLSDAELEQLDMVHTTFFDEQPLSDMVFRPNQVSAIVHNQDGRYLVKVGDDGYIRYAAKFPPSFKQDFLGWLMTLEREIRLRVKRDIQTVHPCKFEV